MKECRFMQPENMLDSGEESREEAWMVLKRILESRRTKDESGSS
jgi:hypothetical protein